MARLISVNAGRVETFRSEDGQLVESAIRKRPIEGPVRVGADGIAVDEVHEAHVHGGPERALHVFARESYAHLEALAGRPLVVPTFGENLTIEGYDEREARVGDRLRVGTAVVEVSMPTERCAKPGRNAGVPELLKWIIASGRSGWYVRVLEPGELRAGDELTLVARGPAEATIEQLGRAMYRSSDPAELEAIRAIAALSAEWKARLEELAERRGTR